MRRQMKMWELRVTGCCGGAETIRGATKMKRRMFDHRMGLWAAVIVTMAVVLLPSTASAQLGDRPDDTLRLPTLTAPAAADSITFPLYLRNQENLSAWSIRFTYDTTLLSPVIDTIEIDTVQFIPFLVIDSSFIPVFEMARPGDTPGGYFSLGFSISEPGVIQGVAVRPPGSEIPPDGSTVVNFFFDVDSAASGGAVSLLEFVGLPPPDDNAFNTVVPGVSINPTATPFRPTLTDGRFTVQGTGGNQTPILAFIGDRSVQEGTNLSFTVSATDTDGPSALTLSATNVPTNATFTDNGGGSGSFNFNPVVGQAGNYSVTFEASDGLASAFETITITVTDQPVTCPGTPPSIASINAPGAVDEGGLVEFTVTASDVDGHQVSLLAINMPPGAEFLTSGNVPQNPIVGTPPVQGVFRWSPAFGQGGSVYSISFQATDADGCNSTIRNVVLTVNEVTFDKLFTTSVDGQAPQGGVPGATNVRIPINFATTQSLEAYGIQFDLEYDATILTLGSIVPSDRLIGFSIYDNLNEVPGKLRVVVFSLAGAPIANGTSSMILELVGRLSPVAVPGRHNLTFTDGWESISPDPDQPSVPLQTVPGNFYVDNRGDANLDTRIDVGDVTSVVSYILTTFGFTDRQFGAADVTIDLSVDVFDLVGIINLIFGRPVNIAPQVGDEIADVTFDYDDYSSSYAVAASLPTDVAGVQLEIDYDPTVVRLSPPDASERASRLALQYHDNPSGRMTVLMIYDPSDDNSRIFAGDGTILNVGVEHLGGNDGGEPPVALRSMKLSDDEAAKIEVAGVGAAVPQSFSLSQNYPNPFNASTVIEFDLAPQGKGGVIDVKLEIFNILGERVRTLHTGALEPGYYSYRWDGTDDGDDGVASGIYFYRLTAGEQTASRKMVLLK